jgi:hypothetical protein
MPLRELRNKLNAARRLTASATWDPAATAATQGAEVSTTVAVPGAQVGDACAVSHTALGALAATLHAHVTSADVVTVRLINTTAVAVNLPTGTLKVEVFRARTT